VFSANPTTEPSRETPTLTRRTAIGRITDCRVLKLLLLPWLCIASACSSPPPSAAAGAAGATADGRDATTSSRSIDPNLAARTFDEAWRIVRDTHFDPEYGGLDWDAVRAELRPRAEASRDVAELRGVMTEMLLQLGLSHFVIIPGDLRDDADRAAAGRERIASRTPAVDERAPDANDAIISPASAGRGATGPESTRDDPTEIASADDGDGTIGMTVRLVEGRVVVTAVRPDGPAQRAGVAPGWVVDRIGNRSVSAILGDLEAPADEAGTGIGIGDGLGEYVITSIIIDRLDRPAGRKVRLEMLDGDDRRVELEMTSVPRPGETVDIGPLRLSGEFASRTVSAQEWSSALGRSSASTAPFRAGVIGFSVWIVPMVGPFHRAVDEFRGADGIVIDLRGNPGGLGGLVMGLGGHFLDEPVSLGSLRSRQGNLEFRTNPRRTDASGALVRPFAGPVAILVDGLSGSTSEIFAGGMQSIGRARVFGSTTAGKALPAVMSTLPNGDTLMHAIADFILPDGTRLEGRGVEPDEAITLTRADLLSGRDPALVAALRWIADSVGAASLDTTDARGARGRLHETVLIAAD